LHIMDICETAYYFGMTLDPKLKQDHLKTEIDFDPYEERDFEQIVNSCLPMASAVNSINRSMGTPEAYPFMVNQVVIDKMKFIHELVF